MKSKKEGGKLIVTSTDTTICLYFLTGYDMTLLFQSNISNVKRINPHEQKKNSNIKKWSQTIDKYVEAKLCSALTNSANELSS